MLKDEWDKEVYMSIWSSCQIENRDLICSESVALVKRGIMKHHYETKYNHFTLSYL